jgi:hypothetical protein
LGTVAGDPFSAHANLKSRYNSWLDFNGRALDALLRRFFEAKLVDDIQKARHHLLRLWVFLPLDLSRTTCELQSYHIDWMIQTTKIEERRGINEFLDALTTNFCQSDECYFERRRELFRISGLEHISQTTMIQIGAYPILVKRLLLQTPLMFWPAIFKRWTCKTFENSVIPSIVSYDKKGSTIIVKCLGNGGFEVSQVWLEMIKLPEHRVTEHYLLDCKYRFKKPSGFFVPRT